MLWRLCGLSARTAPSRRTTSTALEASCPSSLLGASARHSFNSHAKLCILGITDSVMLSPLLKEIDYKRETS